MKSKQKDCNVLFCFHYSGLNNGAVRSMVDVIETLVKKYNINAYVIYPDKKGTAINYLEKKGVTTLRVPFYRIDFKEREQSIQKSKELIKYLIKRSISYLCFKKAIKFCKLNNINIVYSNTTTIDYGYFISKKLNIPHVWHIREFGKEDHNLEYRGGTKKLYSKISQSNAVIYISRAIENKYSNFIDNKVISKVVYNDISPAFINPKKSFNLKSDILHATIIGTLQKGKGQLDAIRAVERVNKRKLKVILHVCGATSGNYYQALNKYVSEHNLQREIVFDGFTRNMNAYRQNMDIGIVSSSNEAFGRVTVEGMLSELLMIGADSAGTSELISDNKNGLLYTPGDIVMLSQKIMESYKNREKMKSLALNGFRYAKVFTKGEAAKKIQKILLMLNDN